MPIDVIEGMDEIDDDACGGRWEEILLPVL